MSYGEPIALRGQRDLEQVASAASVEVRGTTETQFIERLKRGEEAAFESLVSERSGEIYGLLYRLTENPESMRLDSGDVPASFPEYKSLPGRCGFEDLDLSDRDKPSSKPLALVEQASPKFYCFVGFIGRWK